MIFWVILDSALLFLYLIGVYCVKEDKYRNVISVFILSLLTVIASFREGFWFDYYSYVEIYSRDYTYIHQEPLFIVVIYILKSMGFSSQMMFLVYSVSSSIIFWNGINFYIKDSKYKLMAVLLYATMFCAWMSTLGTIRQSLAMHIIFWSSKYVLCSRKKYYLAVCVASLFHYSALIAFLLPIVYKKMNLNKATIIIIIILSYTLGMSVDIANSIIVPILEVVAEGIGIGGSYVRYAVSDAWVKEETEQFGLSSIIMMMPVFFTILIVKINSPRNRFIVNMAALSLCMRGLLSFSAPLMRIRYYFEIFVLLGVILTVDRFVIKDRRHVMTAWVLGYLILHLAKIYIFLQAVNVSFGVNFNLVE